MKTILPQTIGFIGLGAMGAPMARSLAQAGYVLRVFDVRSDVAKTFADETGATAVATAALCVDGADLAITIVPNSDIVQQICLGTDGISSAAVKPRLLIEMTSGVPDITVELGDRLSKYGVAVIDAPVSGGVARAVSADLAIMVGGSDKDVELATPVLQVIGKTITHVGPLGAGQAVKALNNLASATGLLIASEAVWVARKFGLDPERVVDVFNNSSGMNNSTKNKFKPFILSETYASGFSLDLMVKDLRIAVGLSESLGAEVPLAVACLAQWEEALLQLGPGHDHTEVAKVSAERVGIPT